MCVRVHALATTAVPQVEFRAGAAAGVDGQVVLLAELFEEAKGVPLAAMGSLQLLQQEHHGIVDQAQQVGTRHPVAGQRPQPCNGPGLLHPVDHRLPRH